MFEQSSESLVSVYSTPLAFDAEIVRSILNDDGIPSFVEEANSPLAGLNTSPCHVLVGVENENFARQILDEHEARRRERLEFESEYESEPVTADDARY